MRVMRLRSIGSAVSRRNEKESGNDSRRDEGE